MPKIICLVFLAICFLIPTVALGEATFRWEDESGKIYFGSNPPSYAVKVKRLDTKPVSRYSSKKMLGRLKRGASTKYRTVTSQKTPTRKAEPAISEDKNKAVKTASLQVAPKKKKKRKRASYSEFGEITSQLTYKNITLERGDFGEIVSCSVDVINPSEKSFSSVYVAFEFSDGTLVPTSGPDEVAAGTSVEYSIPEELLPISLDSESALLPGQKKEVPKVVLHGIAE